MANSASTTTPGVIIPPIPDHLVDECAAALAELDQRFGVAALDIAVKAHTSADGYFQRVLDATPGGRERLKAEMTRTLGADFVAELFGDVADHADQLAQVIPFPVRAVGGAA